MYQGRFKSFPVDASAHLLRVCRYVERNALTAGLVRKAQDWPWCSLCERSALRHEVPLVTTPFLTSDVWTDFVNAVQPGDPDEWSSVPFEAETVEKGSDPLRDVAEEPGVIAGGAQAIEHVVRAGRGGDDDQPDAHVERAEHLGVGDAAGTLKPLKQRRHGPARVVDPETSAIREVVEAVKHRVPIWKEEFFPDGTSLEERRHGMEIGPVRPQQGGANRLPQLSDVTLDGEAKVLECNLTRQ